MLLFCVYNVNIASRLISVVTKDGNTCALYYTYNSPSVCEPAPCAFFYCADP